MDKKELQEKIALYYSKLPPNAQAVFSSMKWLETLKTISQKYGLNEAQIQTLGTETTLVLLGIIHLVEYEEALTNELKLSRDTTEKILMEIEESIIRAVRPQLVRAFEENRESETDETPEIEQKLDVSFEKLPEEVEDIVKGSNYQALLYNIAKGYNLTIAQMGILETAVTNLINGTLRPEEFEDSLEKSLKLSPETIGKMVNDINEKIFKKIREGLIKITEQKQSEDRPTIPETMEASTASKQEESTQVLNSAGIEIIPEKLELEPAEKPTENREDMLQKVEKPEPARLNEANRSGGEVHPILAQKLSGSLKIPMTTTEHSLGNITKTNTATPTNTTQKIDPYREIPE